MLCRLKTRPLARASRSRCQLHHKRESQRHVNGCNASRIRLHSRQHCIAIPQPTEWQHIGNQIDAAMIFARADFVNVNRAVSWSDWSIVDLELLRETPMEVWLSAVTDRRTSQTSR